ncbi:hypothetical protein FOMPIDRAFT_1048925 [Fomitopsis schrenkii]|uniref:Cytochrome P450 n=1 Tax=Fomitopsis schrenkii TaxID=2126942 RepID=S8E9B9_FOMSC|nr:hypothetical protein FOMPIDRAFT_1048925 [Fomitopsis schrenkii]
MSLLFAVYVFAAFGALWVFHAFFRSHIHAIPTFGGPSLPLLSYIGAVRSLTNTFAIVQEGYKKHKGGCFKYAQPGHWCVVVTSPAAAEELAKAPDDVLSMQAAMIDTFQVPYTIGLDVAQNLYHIPVIRTSLMRNAARMFDDIRDEGVSALSDQVQSAEGVHEWVSVRAAGIAREVICRVSNRAFVGLPICRDADFLAVHKEFAKNVVAARTVIKLFPKLVKPLVARLYSSTPSSIGHASRHLDSIITERLRDTDSRTVHGYYDEKDSPNDLLQWLIESAPQGRERTVPALALRILVVNLAAIHTTSSLEHVVRAEGWSKVSLGHMRLLDGFLKEVLRFSGPSVRIKRKAVQDFTFTDGTFIPKGTFVAVAARAFQFDADYYADPAVFDPRRYEGERGGSKDNSARTDLVFGLGHHTCPGRFFAATALKALLSHIVVTYDVKLPGGSRSIPQPTWIAESFVSNSKANVLFRKRDVCK